MPTDTTRSRTAPRSSSRCATCPADYDLAVIQDYGSDVGLADVRLPGARRSRAPRTAARPTGAPRTAARPTAIPVRWTPLPHPPYTDTPVPEHPYLHSPYRNTPYRNTPYRNTPYRNTPYRNTPFVDTPFLEYSVPQHALSQHPVRPLTLPRCALRCTRRRRPATRSTATPSRTWASPVSERRPRRRAATSASSRSASTTRDGGQGHRRLLGGGGDGRRRSSWPKTEFVGGHTYIAVKGANGASSIAAVHPAGGDLRCLSTRSRRSTRGRSRW